MSDPKDNTLRAMAFADMLPTYLALEKHIQREIDLEAWRINCRLNKADGFAARGG